tara:strand:- start:4613 stop:4804 length:192 start_codon:yes stop_codon:yes gene_type:complete
MNEDDKIHVIQVKLTRKFRKRLQEDAEKHFRSVGMHVKAIITKYFNDKSLPSNNYDARDMENL